MNVTVTDNDTKAVTLMVSFVPSKHSPVKVLKTHIDSKRDLMYSYAVL